MKTLQSLILTFIGFSFALPALGADVSSISLLVETQGGATFSKTGGTEKKLLQIQLTNGGPQDLPVTVKYYFFGREIGAKETMVIHDGKLNLTVKAHSTETVKSTVANAATIKPVYVKGAPAKASVTTGRKIVGYGVRVLQNDNVLTDYFSEPSLKENVGGG